MPLPFGAVVVLVVVVVVVAAVVLVVVISGVDTVVVVAQPHLEKQPTIRKIILTYTGWGLLR